MKRLEALIPDESAKERTGKTYFTKVGVAFESKDGRGWTLQIAPGVAVSGRVLLREPLPPRGERQGRDATHTTADSDDDGNIPF